MFTWYEKHDQRKNILTDTDGLIDIKTESDRCGNCLKGNIGNRRGRGINEREKVKLNAHKGNGNKRKKRV